MRTHALLFQPRLHFGDFDFLFNSEDQEDAGSEVSFSSRRFPTAFLVRVLDVRLEQRSDAAHEQQQLLRQ